MKIAVLGTGYVGTTTAAIFANSGYIVVTVDVDKHKVDLINNGKAPFYEYGLEELIKNGRKLSTLSATLDYKAAVEDADLIFSCVGTPDNPDGSSNLEYVYSAARSALPHMKSDAIFIQKSTVPVGMAKKLLSEVFADSSVKYASNPEFLREGTAIFDTLCFDRVVVGGDHSATSKIIEAYKAIEKHKLELAKIAKLPQDQVASCEPGQYIETSLESAELIKVSANAFLALKISFANSIAKLADKAQADITEVMQAVGADKRIGASFLNAGRGYGGGCFPKDVTGLITSAQSYGVSLDIMTSANELNSSMPGYIVSKVIAQTGSVDSKKVAILGTAFKAGTSDTRKSPAIYIANLLDDKGAEVKTYDPEANEESKELLNDSIKIKESLDEALQDAEIVFVATDWPELINFDFSKLKKSSIKTIVDCMNRLDKQKITNDGFKYIGVGR